VEQFILTTVKLMTKLAGPDACLSALLNRGIKGSSMRKSIQLALPLAAVMLSFSSMAAAVVVPGVFDTGLGVGGAALAAGDGQIDANYRVTATTDPNIVVGSNALTY
jgi:hypothetical protein